MSVKRPKAEIEAVIRDFLCSRNAGKAVQRQLTRNYADWQDQVMMADAQLRVMQNLTARETQEDMGRFFQLYGRGGRSANTLPI